MSSDRETTRIVRSWLEEGVNVLPDRVLDHVLDRLPTTPQRRHWWQAWRNPLVSNTTKFVLGGAAVLVLAAVGIGIYFDQSSGGPGVPGPTPSSTPSSTPAASPAADSQPPSPASSPRPAGDTLAPGTYVISSEPFSAESPLVAVRVPAGYQAVGNDVRPWAIVKSGDEPTAFSGLGVWEVDAVYDDPCHWSATDGQSLGPTVDDFVAALLTQPGRTWWIPGTNPPASAGNHLDGPEDTRITSVSVDGFSGNRLVLGVPPDIAFDGVVFPDCDEGDFRSWPGRFHQAPSQLDDVRVLDVGGTRLIIATTYFPTTSEEDRAELEAMFQSIDIQLP
jgi:hypothetical protein